MTEINSNVKTSDSIFIDVSEFTFYDLRQAKNSVVVATNIIIHGYNDNTLLCSALGNGTVRLSLKKFDIEKEYVYNCVE